MLACAGARSRFWWTHLVIGLVLLAAPSLIAFFWWAGRRGNAENAAAIGTGLAAGPIGTLPIGLKTLPEVAATTLVVATFEYTFVDAHSAWVSAPILAPSSLQPACRSGTL